MFNNFDIYQIALMIVPVLLALTVHEYAHGLAAWKLGDDTAKREGRLTLNPISHMDPIGTLMLFLFKFGWAKPVPFDPRNFKNPARDTTLVALAGPVSNFLTAAVLTILLRIFIEVNFFQIVSQSMAKNIAMIIQYGILINISLGLFNLIPIPPLDGFKVLAYFLPPQFVAQVYRNNLIVMFAFILLLATGFLGKVLWPAVTKLSALLFWIFL